MDSQTIINLAFTGAGALAMFIFNGFRTSLQDIKNRDIKELRETDIDLLDKVQRIEVLVAGKYVTNDQLDKKMDAIFSTLRRIEDKQDNAPYKKGKSREDDIIKWTK